MELSNSKKFETIRNNFSKNKDLILTALEHVAHFIRKHQYKIVGGFSIDANLRLKGEKLYEDDQLPDYDFYSPTHWETAYTLHSELCALGMPADVIVAVHTTTMRVRVDDVPVADITYVPEEIYKRLPTNEYRGMQLIHPHITMLDQMHALSTLYENPPNEVIVARSKKDVARFERLITHFPFEDDKAPAMKSRIKPLPKGCIYTGWSALAHYMNLDAVPDDTEICCQNYLEFINGKRIRKYRNAVLSMSRSAYYDGYRVFDTFGEKITCNEEKTCVSLPYLIYYFLNLYYVEGVQIAKYAVKTAYDKFMETAVVPSLSYGDSLWSMSTLFNIASIVDDARRWKPRGLNACNLPTPTFDPSASPLFAIDGEYTQSQSAIVNETFLQIKKLENSSEKS